MTRKLTVSIAALGLAACWALPALAGDDAATDMIPGDPDGKTPAERAPTLLPDADSREKIGIFSFVLENDLFYNTDRRYTNGVRLTYLTPKGGEPGWLHDAFLSLPMFNPSSDIRVEYGLGQSMYTASDKLQADPPLDDRPYAGWLYGSVGVVASTEQGDGRRVLDQLQLSLGVVGPASLAQQTQDFIHGIVNSPKAQGWDTQLKNEPALQAIYQRSWQSAPLELPAGFAIDATPHAGIALGNVFDFVNTGAMLRFGQNLPVDYGSPRVQPGLPGSGYFEPVEDFGWYLFGGFDGRAVARNIFLDGNTFATSRSVDKRNFVGDAEFGLAVIVHDVRFAYTHVFRTKEYKTQVDADQFGVFSVSFRF